MSRLKDTLPNTKADIQFTKWWLLANEAFRDLDLRQPRFGEAYSAYDSGESPGTFASLAADTDGWNDQ